MPENLKWTVATKSLFLSSPQKIPLVTLKGKETSLTLSEPLNSSKMSKLITIQGREFSKFHIVYAQIASVLCSISYRPMVYGVFKEHIWMRKFVLETKFPWVINTAVIAFSTLVPCNVEISFDLDRWSLNFVPFQVHQRFSWKLISNAD